ETGSSAPVGLLSGTAAALVAAGGYLVLRRRRTSRG
ncbi:LPXTG cell wall anchor domain-containing protein, partial [Streptomyces sp. NPDC047009]